MKRTAFYIGGAPAVYEKVVSSARLADIEVSARYDPSGGMPGDGGYWESHDLVFLTHNLGAGQQSGLNWLKTIAAKGDSSRVVFLNEAGHEAVHDAARRLGVAASFALDDIDSGRLAEWLGSLDQTSHGDTTINTRQDSSASPVPERAAGTDARASINKSALFSTDGIGISIPGYRIERLLARGGMAAVYVATAEDGSRVVLKVLSYRDSKDQEVVRRFMQEYAILAKLDHPNVIRIEDRGFAADFAYIAMEYCPGGDLKSLLNRGAGIESLRALDLCAQVARGLQAAHSLGLVHRDIKPGNLLFRDPDTVLVADFGIAKLHSSQITNHDGIIGTPYYASPEQIKGLDLDARADLYCLGAVMYQLLAGALPFHADNLSSLFDMHLKAPVPRLPAPHAKLQAIIDGLMAKDRDDRFQNAGDLLAGIDWVRRSMT